MHEVDSGGPRRCHSEIQRLLLGVLEQLKHAIDDLRDGGERGLGASVRTLVHLVDDVLAVRSQ